MLSDSLPAAGDVWKREFDGELVDVVWVQPGKVSQVRFRMRRWPARDRVHELHEFMDLHDRVNPEGSSAKYAKHANEEYEDAPAEVRAG